jgi:hypothetical protein
MVKEDNSKTLPPAWKRNSNPMKDKETILGLASEDKT